MLYRHLRPLITPALFSRPLPPPSPSHIEDPEARIDRRTAGKPRGEHLGQGNPWVRSTLLEAARAGARSKDTFLAAQYRRRKPRLGPKRAAIAVAHSLLVIAYHVLKDAKPYQELGADFHDQRARSRVVRRLTKRLESLGFDVSLQDKQINAAPQEAAPRKRRPLRGDFQNRGAGE